MTPFFWWPLCLFQVKTTMFHGYDHAERLVSRCLAHFVQWSNVQLFGERRSERNDLGSFPVLVGMTLILGKNVKNIMYPTVLRQKTLPKTKIPTEKQSHRIHGSDSRTGVFTYIRFLFYGKCKYSSPINPMGPMEEKQYNLFPFGETSGRPFDLRLWLVATPKPPKLQHSIWIYPPWK